MDESIDDYILGRNMADFLKLEQSSTNPWSVENASVFLRYCCPECDFSTQTLKSFTHHAVQCHRKSIVLFGPKMGAKRLLSNSFENDNNSISKEVTKSIEDNIPQEEEAIRETETIYRLETENDEQIKTEISAPGGNQPETSLLGDRSLLMKNFERIDSQLKCVDAQISFPY